jgi:hypothetical protein
VNNDRYLYVFLDESGNLDFTNMGTRYFIIGSVTIERPFHPYGDLAELKYDLAEQGTALEYFHASENAQRVRNQVFTVIQKHLNGIAIDSTIVEKRKTHPTLQELEKFYPKMLGYHLRYVLEQHRLAEYGGVLIYTDRLPIKRKREAIEKAVKQTLSDMLQNTVNYRLLHHDSKSNFNLQIADYCTWAIYRKWDNNDERSYALVSRAVRSEFDIFRTGKNFYY